MYKQPLMNEGHLSFARKITLFSHLSDEEKSIVLKDGRINSYPRKKILFVQGDLVKYFYIVCSGTVQEFWSTADGHDITTNIYGAGDAFSKTEIFLKNGNHHDNAVSVDGAIIMELPINQFKENLQKFPAISNHLLFSLAKIVFAQQVEIEQRATMPSIQLVADFLRQLCMTRGLNPRGFTLPYKKTLIASRLGLKLETLSRILPKLKELGITVRGSQVCFNTSQEEHRIANCGKVAVHPFLIKERHADGLAKNTRPLKKPTMQPAGVF